MIYENWSKSEKEVSRKAFNAAFKREYDFVYDAVVKMVAENKKVNGIWKVADFLNEKRREMDYKYDYRYSRLLHVFGVLVNEKWLSIDELVGLSEEKIKKIKNITEI